MGALSCALVAGCRSAIPTPPPRVPLPSPYPVTVQGSQGDECHGQYVADPYRWLEEDSDATRSWVDAQNRLTFAYLQRIPARKRIKARLTELWNTERFGVPFKKGARYFLTHNNGLQDQSVLYTLDSLEGKRKVLLDPNTLSEDGTTSTGSYEVSPDGQYLAYAISKGGSDWREFKVREIASGKDLSDHLQWIKFSGVSWTRDSVGFYYSRFDEPTEELQSVNHFPKIYYHKLGTTQDTDRLVYQRLDQEDWSLGGWVTHDGSYLVIGVWSGTSHNNGLFIKDLREQDASVQEVLKRFDAQYEYLGNVGTRFIVATDSGAPRKRIISIDLDSPDPESWQEIVPEAPDAIEEAAIIGEHLVIHYLEDASSVVRVYDLAGRFVREIDLPGLGSVFGFDGEPNDPETFFAFSSYAVPPRIYRTDVATGETDLFRDSQVDFDPSAYVTEQVFFPSKDGTQIPMFLTYKQDMVRNGTNPCTLYGYGGFNVSITPGFSMSRVAWLEMGGIYAVANLRGGGEYGTEWHKAGTRHNKQNVFDDFIGAAEWLIEHGYTSTSKLAIAGGSNGGLLVGACMTQRPDLFGACLPAVGVMDMLRFHKFTIGWAWVPDYGSPDDPADFETLLAYSPLHNVKEGTCYPPTLVTTADHDDRVVPAHSFKFTSTLQAAQGCANPVLIRVQTKAGHGRGTPVSVRIEEQADRWAFLTQVLRMEPDTPVTP